MVCWLLGKEDQDLTALRYRWTELTHAPLQEEPYKMTLFGKDPEYMEVVAADFLPEGSKLYILVADSDCNLHVLQYDPEGKGL